MYVMITKFLPATKSSNARVSVTACGQTRFFCQFDNELEAYDAHKKAADAFKARMEWPGELVGGVMPDSSGYAFFPVVGRFPLEPVDAPAKAARPKK